GVVESRAEDGRRPSVEFGRTKYDDRVRRAPLVALSLVPDPKRRVAGDDDRAGQRDQPEANQIAAHRCALAAIIARGISCTSALTRNSTGRCARSGRLTG